MPAHSRPKDGVASLAPKPSKGRRRFRLPMVAVIHVLEIKQGVDGRDKPGHDGGLIQCKWKTF
jgi:hypothetical protein